MAKMVCNCFQTHFSDFNFQMIENAGVALIKKLYEAFSKDMNNFLFLEKLALKIDETNKLFNLLFIHFILNRSKIL